MKKITVLGAGAWGTTLAQVLCDAGNDVVIWGRSSQVVNEINSSHTNTHYLGGIELPETLLATVNCPELVTTT